MHLSEFHLPNLVKPIQNVGIEIFDLPSPLTLMNERRGSRGRLRTNSLDLSFQKKTLKQEIPLIPNPQQLDLIIVSY